MVHPHNPPRNPPTIAGALHCARCCMWSALGGRVRLVCQDDHELYIHYMD